MNNIIGFDFSQNKPAACVYTNGMYKFISWPYNINKKIVKLYRDCDIDIVDRSDIKENFEDVSHKMRFEVQNAEYLSNLIRDTLKPYLNRNTYIVYEGLSYGSGGDSGIQLGAYKYMLMYILSQDVPYDNMYTYSPQTVKSVAGCAKKGMNKNDMIKAFIKDGPDTKFRNELRRDESKFKNSRGINWLVHLDDIVDSYFVINTLRVKLNI